MHYYAKDFFAPIIVTGHITAARNLDVYVVSDILTTFYNVTLNMYVYNWSSLQPVFVQRIITDIVYFRYLHLYICFIFFKIFSGPMFQEKYFLFGSTCIWHRFQNAKQTAQKIQSVLYIFLLQTVMEII